MIPWNNFLRHGSCCLHMYAHLALSTKRNKLGKFSVWTCLSSVRIVRPKEAPGCLALEEPLKRSSSSMTTVTKPTTTTTSSILGRTAPLSQFNGKVFHGFSNAFLTEAACKCLRLGSSSGKLNQTYHIETETPAVDVKIRKRDSLPGANFALLITLNKPSISFHFLKYAPRKARAPDCCLF